MSNPGRRSNRTNARRRGGRIAAIVLSFGLEAIPLWAQPDYPPAHWTPPACTKWYTTGNGRFFCVIHDMEGYYWTSISYLNRCDTDTNGNYNVSASVHYLINGLQNGSDSQGHAENRPNDPAAGDITQSVRESNYAWHAICLNRYSFGTEHEGFASNPAWYSEAMYVASAGLHQHLCDTYGIPKDRNHIIGHGEWQNSAWVGWMAANFPSINVTCNSHTDPGIYWNWSHFMTLINGTNYGNYWDLNGATAGAGATPSGVWNATSTNWTSDPAGASAPGVWGGKIAIFSAGSDALGAYTITVNGTQTVNDLFVQEGTVTFTGGQLNFSGDGPWFSNSVASGCTAIFNTPCGGGASPDKWGAGKVVYNVASTSGGYFSLNQGSIAVGNDAALGSGRFVIGDSSGANVVMFQSADATAHTLANRLVFNANTCNIGAGGDLTFTGPVDIGSSASAATALAVSNSLTSFSGVITNTGGLTKNGPGTLVLSGAGANTYGSATANGNTTVNAGTLKLGKTAGVAAIAKGGIAVNSGGILLLGASDQIADALALTLGGGTFQTAGFDEQLGTLKLSANSTVDLGAGASVIRFAASSAMAWTAGTTLTIRNWSGAIGGGGADQILFGADASGLAVSQVNQVRFLNPLGFPAGTYSTRILATGEVVPLAVPPSITGQPADLMAVVGDTVSFAVSVTGAPTPVNQWRFNNADLYGATAATLLLPGITLTQAGGYSVVVTNLAGAATSRTALLTVYPTAVPTLSAAGLRGDGQFQLSLAGVPGYNYAVLASTNLETWLPLQTNSAPFLFTDPAASNYSSRFYRAQYRP